MLKITNKRHEIKFIYPIHHEQQIFTWIKMSRFFFRETYDPRYVHSIYFDSINHDTLIDAIDGLPRRKKIRYRWYGESEIPQRGILEIKHKENKLSWKTQYKIESSPYQHSDNWKDILEKIHRQVPNKSLTFSIYDTPILITKYFRYYYYSHNRKIRVTVDKDLSAYKQNRFRAPNFTHADQIEDICILEMKFSDEHKDILQDYIRDIPYCQNKYSKYIQGFFRG